MPPHPLSHSERGKTISALWLFAILNTLFRDIHQLVVESTIREILNGHMNGTPVTEAALFAGDLLRCCCRAFSVPATQGCSTS